MFVVNIIHFIVFSGIIFFMYHFIVLFFASNAYKFQYPHAHLTQIVSSFPFQLLQFYFQTYCLIELKFQVYLDLVVGFW